MPVGRGESVLFGAIVHRVCTIMGKWSIVHRKSTVYSSTDALSRPFLSLQQREAASLLHRFFHFRLAYSAPV